MAFLKTAFIATIWAVATLVWSCADSSSEDAEGDETVPFVADANSDTVSDTQAEAPTDDAVADTESDADTADISDGNTNDDSGLEIDTITEPEDTDEETDSVNATAECNATASEGLAEGDLIPNIQLQRCDGSNVTIQELICGVGKVTQVYSFAWWCPDCAEFLGIGDTENPFMSANSLYEDFHGSGYELLVVLNATESLSDNLPTAADCVALEELVVGTVVFDSTGTKTQDALDLKINGGTALAGSDGTWVVAPTGKDAAAEDVGTSQVISTVADECGCGK